jgi:riboflavin biosynthesis pyrimidine reductase
VRDVIVEGGGGLNDALFRAGLVDELHLTLCPRIFGGRRAPSIRDGVGVPRLADAAGFHLASMKRQGDELFLVYRAVRPGVGG